jgi:hypothetical protein
VVGRAFEGAGREASEPGCKKLRKAAGDDEERAGGAAGEPKSEEALPGLEPGRDGADTSGRRTFSPDSGRFGSDDQTGPVDGERSSGPELTPKAAPGLQLRPDAAAIFTRAAAAIVRQVALGRAGVGEVQALVARAAILAIQPASPSKVYPAATSTSARRRRAGRARGAG